MSAPTRSWAPAPPEWDEPQQRYPSAIAVIAAALLVLLFLALAARHDLRCRQWAGTNPDRVAHCDALTR